MRVFGTAPWRWRLIALVALAFFAAWCLRTVTVAWPLSTDSLWAAFSAGTFLGHGPRAFVLGAIPWGLAAFALGAVAVSAGAVTPPANAPRSVFDTFTATPLRRSLLVLSPWLAAVYALGQDDPTRRPAMIASLLGLSVSLTVFLSQRSNDFAARNTSPEEDKPWRSHLPVLFVMALHAVWFSLLAIERDRALWSATIDLGIFKEALYHTLHGRPLYSPTVGYSFLGEHFSPVLFLLVPLYALWPTSACLLIVQTLAISLSAWPVYRLAQRVGLSRSLSTVLAGAMLFTPTMQVALLYDFHMDLLAVPALAWLVWSLHERRYGLATVSLVLLISVKEDMFIPGTAALLTRFVTGNTSDRKRTALMAFLSITWCVIAMAFLIKSFGPPPGVPVYMSDGHASNGYKFLRNFRHLAGRGGPIAMLLGQPLRFGLYAFTDARLTTLLTLVAPLAFLPFAASLRVFLLLPLGIILLSDNPEIVALRYHYSAIQHPGVYLAAVYGAATIVGKSNHSRALDRALAVFVSISSVAMAVLHPGSLASPIHGVDARRVTPHVRAVDRLVAMVPPNAKVTASTWLGPRFSNRPWGVIFPYGLDRADWALVDLQRPPWPASPDQRDATLIQLMRSGFGAVAWADGALLLHRGATPIRNPEAIRALFVNRRYEIEGTEQTDFSNCSVSDPTASDGRARVVSVEDPRPPGLVVFGPFISLPPGRWRVTFRLKATPGERHFSSVGLVDVFVRPGVPLVSRDLTAEDFPDASWQDITVDFVSPSDGLDGVEFRVRTFRTWTLGADVISLSTLEDPQNIVRSLIVRGR